jgi:glycosyltransferase involved in cell wall biosynthesis
MESQRHIAILGSAGVPARYGGFETLAEQLAHHHARHGRTDRLTITCSGRGVQGRPGRVGGATLDYLPLPANGAASVAYDVLSLARARASGADVALLLGVSGAMALPALTRGKMRVIAHVDGREWQRAKWSGPARRFLRMSEAMALRYADAVIADSPAIADDLRRRYGRHAEILTYGGDQALDAPVTALPDWVPPDYALAICRIEPENNVHVLLEACAQAGKTLICVGNWDHSQYGRALRARYNDHPNLHLRDPIYEAAPLQALRRNASLYLHGHSAGGTNPSLVEMMHVGKPVFAFDCIFNRQTTHNTARYFDEATELAGLLERGASQATGAALQSLAQARYRWDDIGAQYFDLFERVASAPRRAERTGVLAPLRPSQAPKA